MDEEKEVLVGASTVPPQPKELSLVELKAIWYDLLVQKQQIEIKMNEINNLIAQKMQKV